MAFSHLHTVCFTFVLSYKMYLESYCAHTSCGHTGKNERQVFGTWREQCGMRVWECDTVDGVGLDRLAFFVQMNPGVGEENWMSLEASALTADAILPLSLRTRTHACGLSFTRFCQHPVPEGDPTQPVPRSTASRTPPTTFWERERGLESRRVATAHCAALSPPGNIICS